MVECKNARLDERCWPTSTGLFIASKAEHRYTWHMCCHRNVDNTTLYDQENHAKDKVEMRLRGLIAKHVAELKDVRLQWLVHSIDREFQAVDNFYRRNRLSNIYRALSLVR